MTRLEASVALDLIRSLVYNNLDEEESEELRENLAILIDELHEFVHNGYFDEEEE